MLIAEKKLFDINPEISAVNFIEYYNLFSYHFNSLNKIKTLLCKLDIQLKILSSMKHYYCITNNNTIFLNSNTPVDTWSLSILLELSKIVIPENLQSKDYIYTFSNSILIPPNLRLKLWNNLHIYISNRNYKLFYYTIKKIDKFVSPESVFFTMIKYYDKDFGKFYQFRIFSQNLRNLS